MMLINGHVFFPHPANWRQQPKWQRAWQTEISPGVIGNEARHSMRAAARVGLTCFITPSSIPEQNRLEDRIRAGKKSGLACAPYWGRGSVLAEDCDGTTVLLTSGHWPWVVNDSIFFLHSRRDDSAFDVRTITEIISPTEPNVGLAMLINAAPSQTVTAGKLVWPVIFGKLSADSMPALTAQRGEMEVTIEEIVSPATATVGAFDLPVRAGVGAMEVGNTFKVGGP